MSGIIRFQFFFLLANIKIRAKEHTAIGSTHIGNKAAVSSKEFHALVNSLYISSLIFI